MHLYETHIAVTDTKSAERFYCDIVGLPFAYRDPARDIVFLWADVKEQAMIGLWGPNTTYGPQSGATAKCHVAFAVSLDELFNAITKLTDNKIDWMPSAQIYFRDPDGHMLEFISILPDPPNPKFNGRYSEWKKLIRT